MIYLDTSVALAQLLGETRVPPPSLWEGSLVSSRLLEYELWTQIHSRKLGASHGEAARALLAEISFVELTPHVLSRALEPFPIEVRTLDALHLASMEFLSAHDRSLRIASYDARLLRAVRALELRIFE